MSVILYSKASYTALSHLPQFQSLCRHFNWDYREFAALLFELNVASYQARYNCSDDDGNIYAERTIERIDSEFAKAIDGDGLTALYRLFGRIDYQCCEYESDSAQWSSVYNRLQWIREKLADRICDEYDRMKASRRVAA
jgi:hypothetical protein